VATAAIGCPSLGEARRYKHNIRVGTDAFGRPAEQSEANIFEIADPLILIA
jgi:hypothetical protein